MRRPAEVLLHDVGRLTVAAGTRAGRRGSGRPVVDRVCLEYGNTEGRSPWTRATVVLGSILSGHPGLIALVPVLVVLIVRRLAGGRGARHPGDRTP